MEIKCKKRISIILVIAMVLSMASITFPVSAVDENGTTRVLIRLVFQEKDMYQAMAGIVLYKVKDVYGNDLPDTKVQRREVEVKNSRFWEGIFELENGYWIIQNAYIVNDWQTDIGGCVKDPFLCNGTPLTVYCPMAEWYYPGMEVVSPEKWVVEGMDTTDFWIWDYRDEKAVERSLLRNTVTTGTITVPAAPTETDPEPEPETLNEDDYQKYLDELFGKDTSSGTVQDSYSNPMESSKAQGSEHVSPPETEEQSSREQPSGGFKWWILLPIFIVIGIGLACLCVMKKRR